MMPQLNTTFVLRVATAFILIMHSVPGMFNNGVNDFGNLYLNEIGFAPFGLLIAWSIKLSHVLGAICFVIEKYVKAVGLITILILIAGIVMVHMPEGWYVVGGGRNGVEFNFLLIAAIVTIMFPKGFQKNYKVAN
jgi:putative oxidoreductase